MVVEMIPAFQCILRRVVAAQIRIGQPFFAVSAMQPFESSIRLGMGDADGNGLDDLCDTGKAIPTVSQWGLLIMTLLLLTGAKLCFGRRPVPATTGRGR